MTVIALINTAAAGVGANGASRMQQALAAAGVQGEVVRFDLEDASTQLQDLAQQKPETFIVWGGDGTHRSALSTIGRSPSPLLLLPGGTKNFLSRSLHGASKWEDILRAALRTPTQRVIPAGEIGEERFFCAALIGAPARLAQARETFRHGQLGRAVGEVGVALAEIADLHLTVRYRDRGHPELFLPRTNLVAALVGPLSVYSRLEIAVLPHPSVMTTLDTVWSSFNSGFRDLPGMVIASADTLEVKSEAGEEIPVVVDGEAIRAGTCVGARFVELGGYCLTAK